MPLNSSLRDDWANFSKGETRASVMETAEIVSSLSLLCFEARGDFAGLLAREGEAFFDGVFLAEACLRAGLLLRPRAGDLDLALRAGLLLRPRAGDLEGALRTVG